MIRFFTLMFLFSFSLNAMQEKDLFPSSPDQYIPAWVWFNSNQDLCIIFAHNIIIVDKWHYPTIDDDEIN